MSVLQVIQCLPSTGSEEHRHQLTAGSTKPRLLTVNRNIDTSYYQQQKHRHQLLPSTKTSTPGTTRVHQVLPSVETSTPANCRLQQEHQHELPSGSTKHSLPTINRNIDTSYYHQQKHQHQLPSGSTKSKLPNVAQTHLLKLDNPLHEAVKDTKGCTLGGDKF